MRQKLIGADAADAGATGHNANVIFLTRYQAGKTGKVLTIKLKSSASGNAKVAIYADSAGEPGALIASTGDTAVVSGWNDIAITSTEITGGTYYWLAVRVDTINAAVYNNSSGTMRYKALTHSDPFPDPAGAGYSTGAFHSLLAGWSLFTPFVIVSHEQYLNI